MDIINFLTENPSIFLMLIAALSLLIGSFLNVVIYRLPCIIISQWNQECREYLGLKSQPSDVEKLNLCLPSSHCPQCKKRLKPWHNIPLISYLVLKGKCAYCKTKIPFRYPIVELICCITSVYVAWQFGISIQTIGGLLFTWILIALTFIDIDHHILPDHLTFLLIWTGLIFSVFTVFADPQSAIFGATAGYLIFAIVQGIFHFITGKVGMGQGDFKLLAGLGAFFGWQQLPIIILLASLIGIICYTIHMIIKRKFHSVPMPFGPYLAIAGWISLMWGPDIFHLYLTQFFNY
jgi:leader peptidase (prepilin peptidase)/N-methyltransferase